MQSDSRRLRGEKASVALAVAFLLAAATSALAAPKPKATAAPSPPVAATATPAAPKGNGKGKATPTPAASPASTPTPAATPTTPPPAATPTPFTGQLGIRIDAPVAGASIDDARTTVIGTVTGPANVGVVVNGVVALVGGGRFVANGVRLAAGDNDLVARASAPLLDPVEATIRIQASGDPLFAVEPKTTSDVPPVRVTYEIDLAYRATARDYEIDFDGNGSIDATLPVLGTSTVDYTFVSPGLYLSRFVARWRGKREYTASAGVLVQTAEEIDRRFLELWNGMNAALAAGDLEGALAHVTLGAREDHREKFAAILPRAAEIVASYSLPERVEQSDEILEYVTSREIEGRRLAFMITAIRDVDGVWRIDAM